MQSCGADEENDVEELIGNESPSWWSHIIDHSTALDVCKSLPKESPLRWRCTIISPVFFKHKVRGTEWRWPRVRQQRFATR